MNKINLIYDKIYNVNNNISIVEDNKDINLVLNNKLYRDFIRVYSLFDNNIFAVDSNNKRYIISNRGKIEDSWDMKGRGDIYTLVDDMVHLGRYVDSLPVSYKIRKIGARGKRIDFNNKLGYLVNRLIVTIHKTHENTYKIILEANNVSIHTESLIVYGKVEHKLIDDNSLNRITVLNNNLRYIVKCTLAGECEEYICNKADKLYKVSKKIDISESISVLKLADSDEYLLIHNDDLQKDRYNFIGISNNRLYLINSETKQSSLIDIRKDKVILNINNLSIKDINNYTKQFKYDHKGKHIVINIINLIDDKERLINTIG